MRYVRRVGICMALGLLSILSGCSPGATSQASATPAPLHATESAAIPTPSSSPSPLPSANPSATPSTPVPVLTCVATPTALSEPLVMLRAADNLHTLIDSFANPAKPVTLCSLSANADSPKFLSDTEIGYTISNSPQDPLNGVTAIQRMSLVDRQPVTLASVHGDVIDVAWSPDGSNVAYIAYTLAPDGSDSNQLWLKVGDAAPSALTPQIQLFGRDGSVDDQTIVRFSSDGHYLLMVDTILSGPAPASAELASFQVRSVPDGGLVWVPPSALGVAGKFGPVVTMATWLPGSDRLYYRDLAGVHTWEPPATVGLFAAGLLWGSPSIPIDDRFVAYSAAVTGGKPHIEVRDLKSGTVRVLPGIFGQPTLLSDSVMLESQFVPNTHGPGPAYLPSGLYVMNLITNVATLLPGNARPLDNWPR